MTERTTAFILSGPIKSSDQTYQVIRSDLSSLQIRPIESLDRDLPGHDVRTQRVQLPAQQSARHVLHVAILCKRQSGGHPGGAHSLNPRPTGRRQPPAARAELRSPVAGHGPRIQRRDSASGRQSVKIQRQNSASGRQSIRIQRQGARASAARASAARSRPRAEVRASIGLPAACRRPPNGDRQQNSARTARSRKMSKSEPSHVSSGLTQWCEWQPFRPLGGPLARITTGYAAT